MYNDEIITEIWRIRDNYVNRHHNNLSEILADLQQRQKSPHSRIVDLRDQTVGPTESSIPSAKVPEKVGKKTEE